MTGTSRTTNPSKPSVVIPQKPKPLSKPLGLLSESRNYSTTKGALEITPLEPKKPRISEVSRRVSDVTTRNKNDDSRRQLASMSTRRETRSQRALTKNDPYVPREVELTGDRYLEYPLNAVRNKITIYRDDLDRLKDDEFLNDTIIEFYLM